MFVFTRRAARLLLALTLSSVLSAQHAPALGGDHLGCGARHLAGTAPRTDSLERAWAVKHRRGGAKSLPPPFVLPLVFHVVHDNGPENVPAADLLASLDRLNEAMANVGYYDQGTGAASQISFCLARRDPANQPTDGITRLVSAELTDLNADTEDDVLKAPLSWDSRQYVNVYVVRSVAGLGLGNGLAGYAYYPSAHGRAVDGVVVEARFLNGDPARASVLIHEIGHYLGLRHTFAGGCRNDDCSRDGDRVCDTPPDQSTVAVPCSGSVNSCSTDTNSGFATDRDDLFINYMDYGYLSCYSAFTAGQRDRMYFFLDGIRRSLTVSPGCLLPCPAPVTAAFTGGEVTIEAGSSLTFTNTSINQTSSRWTVNGTPEATTTDFTRVFTDEGTFTVTLTAGGAAPLCFPDSARQTVRVVCTPVAAFNPAGLTRAGEPRTFPNLSTAADDFEWEVNGTLVSTAEDLVYTFPTAGLYQLCLRASNAFCDDVRCRQLYAAPPPDTTGTGPVGSACDRPFTYVYTGNQGQLGGYFTTAIDYPASGGFLAAGTSEGNSIVVHLAPDGAVIWQTQIFPDGNRGGIHRLMLDGEGMLVGIGWTESFVSPNNVEQAIIFRIDPTTGNLLWGQQFDGLFDRLLFQDLIQPGAGQPYVVVGGTEFSSSNNTGQRRGGIFARFDPATGDLLNIDRHFSPPFLLYTDVVYRAAADRFLVQGVTLSQAVSGTILIVLDGAGNVVSSRIKDDADFAGNNRDLIIAGDDYVGLSHRSVNPLGQAGLRLTKFDATYNLVWTSDYYVTPTMVAVDLAPDLDGGYLLLGGGADGRYYLIKTDSEGGVVWGRSYDLPPRITFPIEALHRTAEGILLATSLLQGVESPALLRLDEQGVPVDNCIDNAAVAVQRDPAPWRDRNVPITVSPIRRSGEDFFFEPGRLTVSDLSCPQGCPPPAEVCDNGIDDDGDGFVDCDDDDLARDCCCAPAPATPGSDTVRCGPFSLVLTPPLAGGVIVRRPDGSTTDTLTVPADLRLTDNGVYLFTYLDSCARTASDTLTLHLRPRPLLDLGPDTTVCENAAVPLLAQPGFERYEWLDGTTTRDFTAFDSGVFWVTATDSCGGVQTDTVRVTTEPATVLDLGQDTLICPGDTLVFSLPGYTDHQWSRSSYIDCTDCPTVRFAPDRDTVLLVAAMARPGCFSDDSLRVRVADLSHRARQSELCAGDTLLVGNQTVTSPGLYFDSTAVGACFLIDTVRVIGLTDTTVVDTIRFCAGGSVRVFGTLRDAPGRYEETSQGANGCDSTSVVVLELRTEELTERTLSICRGDSALIFGVFETAAGTYERTFPGAGGCDSLSRIVLEVNGLEVSPNVLAAACAGEDAGAGEVLVSGGRAPLGYVWSNGGTTPEVANLAPGDYTVTVTDAAGCAAITTLSILSPPEPELTLVVQDETCPGAEDGFLIVNGTEAGSSLSVNGGAYQPSTSAANLAPGGYELTVRDPFGCRRDLTATIGAATGNALLLPPTVELRFGDSVTLTPIVLTTDFSDLRWTDGAELLCQGCPTLTLRPATTLVVGASLPDSTGCPLSAATTIRVVRDELVYAPTAFSPNGDGVNDRWRLYPGPGVERIERVAVYDRWGNEAFLGEAPASGAEVIAWTGDRAGGGDPAVGVYVYTAEVLLFNGERARLSGEIILLR